MTQQPLKPDKKLAQIRNPKILEIFNAHCTKFKNNQILVNKFSHQFLATTKLFIGWNMSI